MKKVAVSKQSVFEDPLFNPGDAFSSRDTDESAAAVQRAPAPELVNTLVVSDEEYLQATSEPMRTKKSRAAPPPKSSPTVEKRDASNVEKEKEKETRGQKAEAQKVTKKGDPLMPASVFENTEGEDLFLPSGGDSVERREQVDLEEELFGSSSSSSSTRLREVKPGGKNLRLGAHDSDSDNEIKDLRVGAMMEREELDFDMFGKSSVRQFEPMQTQDGFSSKSETTTTSVRKDDLILESNDILSDFESLLSDERTTKTSTTVPSVTAKDTDLSAAGNTPVVVDSSYDIDAYISQQEDSGGGGLFD